MPSVSGAPPRKTLIFILVTAFLNLAGIGLIGPVAPFLVAQYTRTPDELALATGLLFTSYSLFQFLAVPGLGALSDRYGRRPLLLICLFGSAVGYALFGLGGSLGVLFLGRIIDGITGGNVGIIQAYIADITPPDQRTRYFGMVGAVAGFGFIVGPAVGGVLATLAGPSAPVFFAALVALVNVAWGYFVMPESLVISKRTSQFDLWQLNPFRHLVGLFQWAQLRWLLAAMFFAVVPFAAMHSNLAVLAKDTLAWDASYVALLFTIVGVVGALVQGGLIRVLLRRYDEVRLALVGALLMIVGFVLLALVPALPAAALLLGGTVVFTCGNSLATPALTGLISQVVSPREQGRVQGVSQSVQSLARVLGPMWGGLTYVQISQGAPYWTGALLFAVAIGCILAAIPTIRAYSQAAPALKGDAG